MFRCLHRCLRRHKCLRRTWSLRRLSPAQREEYWYFLLKFCLEKVKYRQRLARLKNCSLTGQICKANKARRLKGKIKELWILTHGVLWRVRSSRSSFVFWTGIWWLFAFLTVRDAVLNVREARFELARFDCWKVCIQCSSKWQFGVQWTLFTYCSRSLVSNEHVFVQG